MMELGRMTEPRANGIIRDELRKAFPSLGHNFTTERTSTISNQSGKHPDIIIQKDFRAPVVIECEFGRPAVKDAQARIGQIVRKQYSRSAFATDYPITEAIAVGIDSSVITGSDEVFGSRLASGEAILLIQIVREGYIWPPKPHEGTLADLGAFVEYAQTPQQEIEVQIEDVRKRLQSAAAMVMEAIDSHPLSSTETFERLKGITNRSNNSDAAAVTCVAWYTAISIQGDQAGSIEGVDDVNTTWRDKSEGRWDLFVMATLATWKTLANTGYAPAITPAYESLKDVIHVASDKLGRALFHIHGLDQELRSINVGQVINFTGELWQAMLEDRKEFASFYTSPAVAEMLATIVAARLKDEKEVTVVDIACGTGTLLGSTRRALTRQGVPTNGCIGIDQGGIATMLTAKRLMDLGISAERVAKTTHPAGSLALLNPKITDPEVGFEVQIEGRAAFVSNPPYLHSTGKEGGMGGVVRGGVLKDLRAAARKSGNTVTNGTAGQAADFFAIAHRYALPGDVLAFVLPMTVAGGKYWTAIRKCIATEYEDVIVICNASANNKDGLSADTSINELMVVATKRECPGKPLSITYVNLTHVPESPMEGYTTGREILSIRKDAGILATLSYVCAEVDSSGDSWSMAGNKNIELSSVTRHLLAGRAYNPDSLKISYFVMPIETLGMWAKTGPSHSTIGHVVGSNPVGCFEFSPMDTLPYRVAQVSMWHIDYKMQKTILLNPTHGESKRHGDASDARNLIRERGTWFINREPRWTSESILMARTPGLAHGGRAWTSIYGLSESTGRCLAIFYNSIFGAIVRMGTGRSTQVGRTSTPVSAFLNLPCPYFDVPESHEIAADGFDRLANLEFLPFAICYKDPARHEIDLICANMLGLGTGSEVRSMLAIWRLMFASEPQVNGRQKRYIDAVAEFYASGECCCGVCKST